MIPFKMFVIKELVHVDVGKIIICPTGTTSYLLQAFDNDSTALAVSKKYHAP
jgi:hypothetical protein